MTNDESNPNDEVEISGGTVLKKLRCLERLDRESGPERVTEREQGRTTSRIPTGFRNKAQGCPAGLPWGANATKEDA